MEYPNQKFDAAWVTTKDAINDDVISWTNSFGAFLTEKVSLDNRKNIYPLTTGQLRKFFGDLKKIQSDFEKNKTQIPLLRAKLAYAVGRDMGIRDSSNIFRAKSKIQELYDELSTGITAIKGNKDNFLRFVQIVESIVAFHKLHGGRDK